MLRRPNSLMNGSAQKSEGKSVKLVACDADCWGAAGVVNVADEAVLFPNTTGTGNTCGGGGCSTGAGTVGVGTVGVGTVAGEAIAPDPIEPGGLLGKLLGIDSSDPVASGS